MFRRHLIAALLAASSVTAAAAETPPGDLFAPYRTEVAELCRAVMAGGGEAAAVSGLCDCTVNGVVAVSAPEPALRFLKIWAGIARLRAELGPAAMGSDAARAAAEKLIAEVYPDGVEAGRREMQGFSNTTVAVAGICVAGFKASGAAPPSFTAMDFLGGFERP